MAADLLTDASRALDANANAISGATWTFYATGTLTLQPVYTTAALNVAHANPVSADAGGKFPPIYFDASLIYRGILRDEDGATISDVDPINSSVLADIMASSGTKGAGMVGFSHSANPGAGTTGKTLQQRGALVTDDPYNADATGVSDSSSAFAAAIADLPSGGGTIRVPDGTYRLDTQPTWTGSIVWDISPNAEFTGAGTGQGKFPYMNTNAAQMAVGTFIQSRSYQKSSNPNGGIAAFNVEMIQPDDYGAGQSVAVFAGARATCDDPDANTWGINVVVGVLGTAEGTHQGIEIDIDTNSTLATTKGMAITGGGTANADVAIEIDRAAMKWDIGISISHATNGIFLNTVAGGTGISINGAGVNVVGIAGTAFSAIQVESGKDVLLLQRITDTAPSGYFLRAVNQANNANLFSVDVAGNTTIAGTIKAALLPGPYADDAAAAAAGVVVTQFYRTSTSVRQRVA